LNQKLLVCEHKTFWEISVNAIHAAFMLYSPSPKWVAIFTCHWMSLSLVSKAKTTVRSWQMMAAVLDSLSKVKPDDKKHNEPLCFFLRGVRGRREN